ncbi:hypothetical protein [Haliea sp. E17]|uniref:hypothetical protein n=1 Tax=Haliea sp. E17 TaxID=3401576 RepID=UPI003AAA53A6
MRKSLIFIPIMLLAGCSTGDIAFNSPYDLDRDGVMDARCPGMEYDTSKHTFYGWRSKASDTCEEQAASGS